MPLYDEEDWEGEHDEDEKAIFELEKRLGYK